jgi:hypothetical protein
MKYDPRHINTPYIFQEKLSIQSQFVVKKQAIKEE